MKSKWAAKACVVLLLIFYNHNSPQNIKIDEIASYMQVLILRLSLLIKTEMCHQILHGTNTSKSFSL